MNAQELGETLVSPRMVATRLYSYGGRHSAHHHEHETAGGITLRHYLAGLAMQGLLANTDDEDVAAHEAGTFAKVMADNAVEFADAVLAALARTHVATTHDEPSDDAVDSDALPAIPTRYDWSKAPEWATHGATDSNGDRFWYESEPELSEAEKQPHGPQWSFGKFINGNLQTMDQGSNVGSLGPRPDWRDTLEARPDPT